MSVRPTASPQFVLLSGTRGAGKTTLCERVVFTMKLPRTEVCGVISQAVVDPTGLRTAYKARELSTGWTGRLATATEPSPGSVYTGRYVFDETTIEQCVSTTIKTLAGGATLLVLDEIGPLEMEQHRGFFPILATLRDRKPLRSLVTVRPSLAGELAALIAKWGITPTILEVTSDTVDAAYRAIQRRLAPSGEPSSAGERDPSETL